MKISPSKGIRPLLIWAFWSIPISLVYNSIQVSLSTFLFLIEVYIHLNEFMIANYK